MLSLPPFPPCLCLPSHTHSPVQDHIIQKIYFQRSDWCLYCSCPSLSWLWQEWAINTGVKRCSITQNVKLLISNFFILRKLRLFPLLAYSLRISRAAPQLAEISVKLQWLIYYNWWQETELSQQIRWADRKAGRLIRCSADIWPGLQMLLMESGSFTYEDELLHNRRCSRRATSRPGMWQGMHAAHNLGAASCRLPEGSG